MLNEGKTIGPNSMHGDTTTMLNEEYYNEEDDDTDKTLVNSKSSIKSGKFRSDKDEEVLFRLSMSPY
ncbi:hypothetical protein IW142_000592 [Coemansia sp. RSA 564]|nr:hypothetical protein IW142_000592 [Coemansia sp. RSA 564]